jgi:hypothetical protein
MDLTLVVLSDEDSKQKQKGKARRLLREGDADHVIQILFGLVFYVTLAYFSG